MIAFKIDLIKQEHYVIFKEYHIHMYDVCHLAKAEVRLEMRSSVRCPVERRRRGCDAFLLLAVQLLFTAMSIGSTSASSLQEPSDLREFSLIADHLHYVSGANFLPIDFLPIEILPFDFSLFCDWLENNPKTLT